MKDKILHTVTDDYADFDDRYDCTDSGFIPSAVEPYYTHQNNVNLREFMKQREQEERERRASLKVNVSNICANIINDPDTDETAKNAASNANDIIQEPINNATGQKAITLGKEFEKSKNTSLSTLGKSLVAFGISTILASSALLVFTALSLGTMGISTACLLGGTSILGIASGTRLSRFSYSFFRQPALTKLVEQSMQHQPRIGLASSQ